MPIIPITEAFPIIIPNMVKLLRILLASSVVVAILMCSRKFIGNGYGNGWVYGEFLKLMFL
jgi:hypothetical protein